MQYFWAFLGRKKPYSKILDYGLSLYYSCLICCTLDVIRTRDLLIRNQLLYPTELRGHVYGHNISSRSDVKQDNS